MDNILIVLGILILATAIGGTQLKGIPGAPLSFGALLLALLNPVARETLMSNIPLLILFVVLGVVCFLVYRAEKAVATDAGNSSSRDKRLADPIFQVILIMFVTFFFVGLFFIGVNPW